MSMIKFMRNESNFMLFIVVANYLKTKYIRLSTLPGHRPVVCKSHIYLSQNS